MPEGLSRSKIAARVQLDRPHLYRSECEGAVKVIFDTIARALSTTPGASVMVPDLMTLSVRGKKGTLIRAHAHGQLHDRLQVARHLDDLLAEEVARERAARGTADDPESERP